MINLSILDDLDVHNVTDSLIGLCRLRKKYPDLPDDEIIRAFDLWHHSEHKE